MAEVVLAEAEEVGHSAKILSVMKFNVRVNNFSVMSGRSHRFLAFNQCSGELMCLAQGHDAASVDRTQYLSIRSPMLYHYATALPYSW